MEAVVVHCVGMLSIMGKMRRIGAAKEDALAGARGKCWECSYREKGFDRSTSQKLQRSMQHKNNATQAWFLVFGSWC